MSSGVEHYPVPEEPPRYDTAPTKVIVAPRVGIHGLLDALFIAAALLLALWMAIVLFLEGLSFSPARLAYLLVFWLFVTYFALPRAHQLFTLVYVPNYFIGRTRTSDGLLGDPVNLAFDGAPADIHAAMQKAGWVLADERTLRSAWRMIVSSVLGRSYPEAPVSDLHLLGNRHEFAYQQEVDGNTAKRHHVRFFKVPDGWVLPGGHRAEWLAAGTYDRSVGLSSFTFQITHKIDADTDRERDYIVNSLRYHDPEIQVRVIEDFSTAYHHRNGGGDQIHTDGDLPVVDVSRAYARYAENTELPQPRDSHDHEIPPPPLLFAMLVIALDFLAMALLWIGLGITGQAPEFLYAGRQAGVEIGFLTGSSVLSVIFLIGTLRRSRWARIGLMAVASLTALRLMLAYGPPGDGHLTTILECSVAVLVLLSVSADRVRQWVLTERTNRRWGAPLLD